ncbi:MAG: pentapeptide repeat-containing protein [Bacteroidia bacterium]|nr:pentapeptide repeat-containing protein [Bacteroidia bacterium]
MEPKDPHSLSPVSYSYEDKMNSRRLIIDTINLVLAAIPKTKGLKADHILNVAQAAGWLKNDDEKVFTLIHKALLNASLKIINKNIQLFTVPFSKKTLKTLSEDLAMRIASLPLKLDKSFFVDPGEAIKIHEFYEKLSDWLHREGKLRKEKAVLLANELGNYFDVELIEQWRKNEDHWQSILEFYEGTPFSEGYLKRVNMKAYQNHLRNMYFKPVMGDEKGMSLSDVYIEPDFRIHERCFEKEDKRPFIEECRESNSEAFAKVPFNGSIHKYVESFFYKENPLNLLSGKAQVMILLGYPGQGKTSFCSRTIYDFLQGSIKKPVYFVRLRDLQHPRDLINAFESTLRNHLEKEIEDFIGELDEEAFQNAVWILDGLDELHMKEGFSNEDISKFCDRLANKTFNKPNLQILFTSRYGYVSLEKLQKERFQIVRLEPFTEQQQLQWLENYKDYYPETQLNKETLIKINQASSSLHHLQELANQPILLHLIATSKEGLKEGDKRVSIYNNLFRTLIDRKWSKDRSLDQHRNLKPRDLEKYLMEIALAIFQSNNEYVRSLDLESFPATERFMKKLGTNKLGDVLKNLMVSFYFREVNKKDTDKKEDKRAYAIEFLHKSLMEYLVAKKIWYALTELLLSTNRENEYYTNDWKDVLKEIAILFGEKKISEEIWGFLKEIIELEDEKECNDLQERMKQFLPALLKRDFLDPSVIGIDAISKALNIFGGYWISFSFLGLDRNFISEAIKGKFSYLLKAVNLVGVTHLNLTQQNFSFGNLEGAILDGANLEGANLEGANLEGANLEGANLEGANLEGANLFRANLEGAKLEGANLFRANLEGAKLFRANLEGANLEGANLEGANLYGAKLEGAKLEGAHLFRAHLFRAHLFRANLEGANLEGANLEGANLDGANLFRANLEGANLEGANLEGANLEGANLEGANLYGAKLYGAKLEGAHLFRANLEGANLEGANLFRAHLFRANLEGANLEGANLEGANLEGANLEGANLEGANLEGANLEGANLEGANLEGAHLFRANLEGANLYGANLFRANLEGANLEGANLEGANLEGANLEGAKLSLNHKSIVQKFNIRLDKIIFI